MSPDEQERYRSAIDPWKRKAERERRVIDHVIYREGHATVTTKPRAQAAVTDSEAEERIGTLL